ncbi:chaperone modulator CbpM [Pontiellaceae bacterium B12219]|nr:chaperone modulator CbpM [Pontiellaceae bacterium B12219]
MSVKYSIVKIHQGRLVDEEEELTLMQFSRACSVLPELIIEMVNEGILEPRGEHAGSWRFKLAEREMVRTVMHLHDDLRVNIPGAALALQLLERIARLEAVLARR